jgi:hypothetical protein
MKGDVNAVANAMCRELERVFGFPMTKDVWRFLRDAILEANKKGG